MSSNRPSQRELEELWAEIRQRMGVCPSFFRLAAPDPAVARSLFDLAKFAYLDSPIPAELKEKLFTYLSRFCSVRYCVARHTAFLLGRGYVAGDPVVPPVRAEEVAALLEEELPDAEELPRLLAELGAQPAPLENWPEFQSPVGKLVRIACTQVFLEPERSTAWCEALRRLLGPQRYEHLMLFLAFVRTAHFWTEVHPELELEGDVQTLLEEHELLAHSVFSSDHPARLQVGKRLTAELRELREAAAFTDALRESEERFRILAEAIPAMVWTARPDGFVLYVNQRWLDYTGQTPDEYQGSGWGETIHPEDRPRILAQWESCRRSGEVYEGEIRYRRRDGEYRWHYFRGLPLRGDDGVVTAWYGASLDIQEKKAAEEALRESEQRFSRFMQHLPGLAWIKDLQGRYVYANEAAERAFRTPRTRLYGRTDEELFPPPTAAQFRDNDRRALGSEGGIQTVETLEHDDGLLHHSLISKFPIPTPDGRAALVGGMAIDITERMQAEEALREADRRKDEFLAMLAHELRNPLAPLRNMVEIMKRAEGDVHLLRQARDVMERQLGQMVRLVDDLLDVSRISRGKITLRKERCEVISIVSDAVDDARALCESLGQELTVALPGEPTYLDADPTRIAQVVGNLLNNASKFTPRGGQVRLAVERDGQQVVIRVQDTGIGVAAEQLPNIFEMFSQVDTPPERSRGGLGIGLSLVKKLVEMHGGTVEARSAGLGLGTEFVVRLPIPAEMSPLPSSAPAPQRNPAVNRRILVVDDNLDSAESLAMLLQHSGHEVHVAHDGLDALAAAVKFHPEIVLLDIGMPKLDGYETARLLREQQGEKDVVLVAVTGWGKDEDRRRSKEAGFDAHLVKPIDPASLDAILAEIASAEQVK